MGAGHDGAARELRRRLEGRGHHVEVIDFLDAVAFHVGPVLRWSYEFQLRTCPWAYDLTYRLSRPLRGPAVLLDSWLSRRRLRRAIRATRPDAIVSVYPFASLVLGRMRRTKQLRVPVATYLTDFAVHPLWVHRGIDRHLAVSPASAHMASRRGGRDVMARGPLVGERFRAAGADREAARDRLGLEPHDRAVLVVAGSLGVGEVVSTVDAITRTDEFHPIVVCGNNETLVSTLERRAVGTILGWTDAMPELMVASDALVENAGGLTSMEAFSCGLPVITYQPIAGHGRGNAQMMEDAGVSRYARDEAQLHAALRELTAPGPERDRLIAGGRSLFTGDPAADVDDLAASQPATTRAGVDRPLRVATARRAALAIAAVVAVLLVGPTFGAQSLSAMGVGVAHPPPDSTAAYLGVRVTAADLHHPALLRQIRALGASVVIDATVASHDRREVTTLARSGLQIVNGGWGHGSLMRWERAHNDIVRASSTIRRDTGVRLVEFAPGRPLDAFDQYYAHRAGEKLVHANQDFDTEHVPRALAPGKVYLLDGRNESPHELSHALVLLRTRLQAAKVPTKGLGALR